MSRDKVEMWAMTRFNSRKLNAFTNLMVGKSQATVKTAAPVPRPPPGFGGNGGGNGGGWAAVAASTPPPVSRQQVEQIANSKINTLVPGIVRSIITNDNDNAIKTLKNSIVEAAKNEARIKFGKIYESFLIHELTKHNAIPRYKGFTGSLLLTDRDSVVNWVTAVNNPTPAPLSVTSRQVIEFVNTYSIIFDNMIKEYNAGTNARTYNGAKLGPPNVRRLRSIQRVTKGYNDGSITMTANGLWLQRMYVNFINPSGLDKVRSLYIAGWFGLVLNLEVDLGGHAWIETDGEGNTIHHLHFGEIKSSPNLNTSKGGVMQLIRLAFIAMNTMELLSEANFIRVEAALFINDDEESFDFVSNFSPPALNSHAKRILSALNIREVGGKKLLPMPSNAQFILSYQKIRGLEPDTRGGDDGYGTILELYNNEKNF